MPILRENIKLINKFENNNKRNNKNNIKIFKINQITQNQNKNLF